MNAYQALWWEQARSDWAVFGLLRSAGVPQCHTLHYLQMATEKLGKAYFWQDARPQSLSHATFVPFLQALTGRSRSQRAQTAACLGLGTGRALVAWVRAASRLAHSLQQLAPSLAGDGPNPEYPWPHAAPTVAPATHQFRIWTDLTETATGRRFLARLDSAVARFPDYA